MPNKVTWKKGMRLTADIFNSMDTAYFSVFKQLSLISSAGRLGLYTALKPFEISVNVSDNILEVVSLRCNGITKSGQIVEIDFNSEFSHTFDTRVPIPQVNENESLLLVVKIHDSEWREINETLSEIRYSFALIGENTKIGDDALPIGRVVNQFGWRLDETDYVPPSLFLSSHPKFNKQLLSAIALVKDVYIRCQSSSGCEAKILLASVWNGSSMAWHRLDKERDTLTPSQLFSILQSYITSFVIGCSIDEHVSLEEPEPFIQYGNMTLDIKSLYRDIEMGLSLCEEIGIKMNAVCTMTEDKPTVVEQPSVHSKPKPVQEPKVQTRNRWTGLEI